MQYLLVSKCLQILPVNTLVNLMCVFVSQMALLYYLIVQVSTGVYEKVAIINPLFTQVLGRVVLQQLDVSSRLCLIERTAFIKEGVSEHGCT